MKKIVKLLALIMAVLMSVSIFAACENDKQEPKDEKKQESSEGKTKEKESAEEDNSKEFAKEVVLGYLGGYSEKIASADDHKSNLEEFVASESAAYTQLDDEVAAMEADKMTQISIVMLPEKVSDAIMVLKYNAIKENSDFEIKEVEKDGDKVIVKAEGKVPDVSEVENSDDFLASIMDVIGSYLEEKDMTLLSFALAEEEEINTILEAFVDERYTEIEEIFAESAKNATKTSVSWTFTVEQSEDKWLITDIVK